MPDAPLEIIELEQEDGEVMLFAWGVHDKAAFAKACGYGWLRADDPRLRHMRYLRLNRNPHTGQFARWYEPVMGEPNATVYCHA